MMTWNSTVDTDGVSSWDCYWYTNYLHYLLSQGDMFSLVYFVAMYIYDSLATCIFSTNDPCYVLYWRRAYFFPFLHFRSIFLKGSVCIILRNRCIFYLVIFFFVGVHELQSRHRLFYRACQCRFSCS